MKREILSQALDRLDERHISDTAVFSPGAVRGSPERIGSMKAKRIVTLALAAALILALGAAAYAAWSIHLQRQEELKEDLQIVESRADSYVEYQVPDEQSDGLVLLSSVNDGTEQRVYVNVSPISPEEAAGFPDDFDFSWSIRGTRVGGFAAPQLPVDLNLSGSEEIRAAVLEYAYDQDSQTMTLQCYLSVEQVNKALAELGDSSVPLLVHLYAGDQELRSFGPVSFSMTEAQQRVFDFGGVRYYDEELDKEIELLSLELTPFSAVWVVRYDDAAAFHRPGADWDAYRDWATLEDRICMETRLIFSDGSGVTTGGVLAAPFEDGAVRLHCGWGRAIDINDIRQIVLGDLVLWQG